MVRSAVTLLALVGAFALGFWMRPTVIPDTARENAMDWLMDRAEPMLGRTLDLMRDAPPADCHMAETAGYRYTLSEIDRKGLARDVARGRLGRFPYPLLLDRPSGRDGPEAIAAAGALPILIAGDWDSHDGLNLYLETDHYIATLPVDGATLEIFGTRRQACLPEDSPSLQRWAGRGLLRDAELWQTFYGIELSFRRYGASYMISLLCDQPYRDDRCSEPQFIREVKKTLLFLGYAPPTALRPHAPGPSTGRVAFAGRLAGAEWQWSALSDALAQDDGADRAEAEGEEPGRALQETRKELAIVTDLVDPRGDVFTYDPPGVLIAKSGRGVDDDTVYAPGIRFPLERAPAYANSQVYLFGGYKGPGGAGQCDPRNYSYPWQDNYCELRQWEMPLCPAGRGHQGQDIRPATCEDETWWAVAAEPGTVTSIGSFVVTLMGESGTVYRYLHMEMEALAVKAGERVERGQRLGLVSSDFGGVPTTIHLHFDMRQNVRLRSGRSIITYVPPYTSLVTAYKRLLRDGDEEA